MTEEAAGSMRPQTPMDQPDLNQIELLVLDVDGVMTDGRISYDDAGRETKTFCVRDGAGLKFWHRVGKRSAIITGRQSPVVARRAEELGISVVRQNAKTKLPVLQEVLAELGVSAERAAYMGDDLMDLPPMRACGLRITVPDAPPEVQAEAHWMSPRSGGDGAVRWAIERILRETGQWGRILERYQARDDG